MNDAAAWKCGYNLGSETEKGKKDVPSRIKFEHVDRSAQLKWLFS